MGRIHSVGDVYIDYNSQSKRHEVKEVFKLVNHHGPFIRADVIASFESRGEAYEYQQEVYRKRQPNDDAYEYLKNKGKQS